MAADPLNDHLLVSTITQDVEVETAAGWTAPYVHRWVLVCEIRDFENNEWQVATIVENGEADVGHLGLLQVASSEMLDDLTPRAEEDD